jgi:integrase
MVARLGARPLGVYARAAGGHHLHERLALNPDDRLDFHELRHFGASDMLNVLHIEPWLIAKQLRHNDEGALVLRLYGHPDRDAVLDQLRRGWGGNVRSMQRAGSARHRAHKLLGGAA